MHDIDRALFEGQEEGSTWGEISDERSSVAPDGESYESQFDESFFEDNGNATELWGGSSSYGTDELALAAELLAMTNEEELDQFLGNLVKGAVSTARSFVVSDAGKAVGNILKSSPAKCSLNSTKP